MVMVKPMNNYQKIYENIINEVKSKKEKPSLLLHSCCGPCSSSVIEQLSPYFKITIIYYNPNIEPIIEYEKRKQTQLELLKKLDGVGFIDCDYDNAAFRELITPAYAISKEGGSRCTMCFELRLNKTAEVAKTNKFTYFGTTLSISPHKNHELINELGHKIAIQNDLKFLTANFKKSNGYLRSIELAKEYNLYRQDYCGCLFSRN